MLGLQLGLLPSCAAAGPSVLGVRPASAHRNSHLPCCAQSGFAGVYEASPEWESQDAEDRRSAGRSSSRGAGGSGGGGSGGEDAAAAFQPGQDIYVKSGSFADFEGKVVAASGGRVTAELDIFGKPTKVELSPGDVTPGSASAADGA